MNNLTTLLCGLAILALVGCQSGGTTLPALEPTPRADPKSTNVIATPSSGTSHLESSGSGARENEEGATILSLEQYMQTMCEPVDPTDPDLTWASTAAAIEQHLVRLETTEPPRILESFHRALMEALELNLNAIYREGLAEGGAPGQRTSDGLLTPESISNKWDAVLALKAGLWEVETYLEPCAQLVWSLKGAVPVRQADFDKARNLWKSKGYTDYDLKLEVMCYCDVAGTVEISVRDGKVQKSLSRDMYWHNKHVTFRRIDDGTLRVYPQDTAPYLEEGYRRFHLLTMDDLFDRAQHHVMSQRAKDHDTITYHPTEGYPVLQYSEHVLIPDSNFGYRVEAFVVVDPAKETEYGSGRLKVAFKSDDWPITPVFPEAEIRGGGTLNVAFKAGHSPLDPILAEAGIIVSTVENVFETLLSVAPDGSYIPELATDWYVDDDLMSYTFNLRQGVMYHNGAEFTADDVLFTFDRLMNPGVSGKTADDFSDVLELFAFDNYTVQFYLKSPNGLFLDNLHFHKASILDSDTDIAQLSSGVEVYGTGPFKLDELVPNERITMSRNYSYWSPELPDIDELVFMSIPDSNDRIKALKAGEVDIIVDVDALSGWSVLADTEADLLAWPTPSMIGLFMDTSRAPFDSKLVRKAFQLAIDRELVFEEATFEAGSPAFDHPVWINDQLRFEPKYAPTDYDREKAVQLLADAGYPPGDLGVTLHHVQSSPSRLAMAEAFKESMDEVGVRVDIQLHPPGHVFTDEPFVTFAWPAHPNPDRLLTQYYHSASAGKAGGYENAELDALIERARTETAEQQRVTYAEIQRILVEDVPRLVLAFTPVMHGVLPGIYGLESNPFNRAVSFRSVRLGL